ncbi:Endonuclease, Uma2 family (restriction endonuclease fold) [Streptomyces sp. WMMB 714]|uniref:Uma2 family endonuclease n=1 Tax=Streptomyces sp. WMMB 714 TaxID=1286822 RepID=UPI0005F7CF54|nr:Uma2 family endonuclease [Streptomyces sp. WMMB 714]SCK27280.1 Endonuclease, Uma2 family (restriction endonuclease fold) [Streptomyces sp. WMMB 714]
MTVMAERTSQMQVEEFEEIASKAPETVMLEFVDGRIGVKSMPDGDHDTITMWLLRQCIQARPDLDLHPERGLRVGSYRNGRARADGALAPVAHFAGQGEWADPEGVLMVVEVTSYDEDTDRRDRVEKPPAYAAAGVPVYLLIDRDSCTVVVHSCPDREGARYRDVHTARFGEAVTLPEPVGIELETDVLKNYVR